MIGPTASTTRSPGETQLGDDGSNDLLVSEALRANELQAWFLAEHLVDTPLVNA